MKKFHFNRYLTLVKHWAWLIVLGVVLCGSVAYIISIFTKPTYQATATFVINIPSSAGQFTRSTLVLKYTQLLTQPVVLNSVVAKHRGMTLQQLKAMITVKSQTDTQTIELDVQSNDPHLATQVANDIGQSYLYYAELQLPRKLRMFPAEVPTDPVRPKPLQDAGIAALSGLGLAVALIIVFECVEGRLLL